MEHLPKTAGEPVGGRDFERVAGRHNARLKQLRMAFRRGELTAAGECPVEGMKMVEEAIRSGLRLGAVFFRESARSSAARLLPQVNAHADRLLLPDPLFDSVVPSETPQGVAALVKVKIASAGHLLERANRGPIVVVAGLQDPGNLGTILRSAEAFGAAGVCLTEGTVSPFNSKVVRGSAGSIFRLHVVRMSSGELIPFLRGHQVRLVATSSHKGAMLPHADWTLPLAIFIGNEGLGLARDLMHQMDTTLVIPQAPEVESLNAGVAASILLYEAARSRASQSLVVNNRSSGEVR